MTKLSTTFLVLALALSTVAHVFEQKSIRIQRQTIQILESTMNKQTAAIEEQNQAMGMCRSRSIARTGFATTMRTRTTTMTSATTKNETQDTYGMRLPEGMTCADCARFRFCDVFLGGNIAGNTECDWAPSRFIQRPAPKPAGERKL